MPSLHEVEAGIVDQLLRADAAGEAEGEHAAGHDLLRHGDDDLGLVLAVNAFDHDLFLVGDPEALGVVRVHPEGAVAREAGGRGEDVETRGGRAVLPETSTNSLLWGFGAV